jgi:TrmH family RNA methyltransferase
LRALLRDPRAREEHALFVAEGPRVVEAAFVHGASVERVYVGGESALSERARAAGVPVIGLPPGSAERIGDTRTPQPVFAIIAKPRVTPVVLDDATLLVVGVHLSDPGNVGTLMRSAAAAGAPVLTLGPGSVDAYNPKVVRASAGACFAIKTLEDVPAVEILETLGTRGVRRVGAVANGGRAPEAIDLCRPTALVLGHEARGLDPELPLEDRVSVPMRTGESLNVAMAGTALLFEAARQRRSSGA